MLCQQQGGVNVTVFNRQMKGSINRVVAIIGVGSAQQQSFHGSRISLPGAGQQQCLPLAGKGQHYLSGRERLFVQRRDNPTSHRAVEMLAQPGRNAVGVKQMATWADDSQCPMFKCLTKELLLTDSAIIGRFS